MLSRKVERWTLAAVVLACALLSASIIVGCTDTSTELETDVAPTPSVEESDPAAARAPNILIIIADDVGVDQIGAYGEGAPSVTTPVIDALAARGILFRNTWSNPVCSSTRATILTGRYSFRTGVGFVAEPGEELRDREHTLPKMLSRHPSARYGTAAFGKWHLNAGRTWEDDRNVLVAPYRAGFSYHRGVFKNLPGSYESWPDIRVVSQGSGSVLVEGGETNTNYNTSETVNHAGAWIRDFEARRPDDPWFLWLAFNAAHTPFHKPPQHLHSRDLSDPALTCTNPAPYADPGNLVPCYQAMIEAMDTEIGRLLNMEMSKESLGRTTVIFVGDNGSETGTQAAGLDPSRAKGTPYEGGVNVPLVVAGAGVESAGDGKARESRVLVNTTDLFATALELAGIDVDATVPSRYASPRRASSIVREVQARAGSDVILDSYSLLPHIQSPDSHSQKHARHFAYTELFRDGPPDDMWPVANAIRNPRGFKLIRFFKASIGAWREELYDLASDPFERVNLIGLQMNEESRRAHLELVEQLDAIEASGWRPHGGDPR